MRIERLLARLSGGSLWRDPRGEGGRGKPAISVEELMGALGGLRMGPSRLAYVMWGLSDADVPALERITLIEAAGIKSVARSGIGSRPGLLQAFCRVAIIEVISPPLCRTCKGVGHKGSNDCPACEGSGNASLTLREKASIASDTYTCSKDTWKAMAAAHDYEAVYRMVEGWKGEAIGHVMRQFREEVAV